MKVDLDYVLMRLKCKQMDTAKFRDPMMMYTSEDMVGEWDGWMRDLIRYIEENRSE